MEEKTPQERAALITLNGPAPDFSAKTTHGKIKLSDYEGKWVILFSHPADFTPVCTTEFLAFAEIYEDLKKLNTELLGLSVDSVYSHIGWVRNIERNFGVKIPFPIIADLDMKVSTLYGMIHPGASDTSTVRTVFIIDPRRNIRTMLYYPLSNGRNMQEILRILKALQTSDKYGVSTPANWTEGDDVIVPPPSTADEAEKRVAGEFKCTDWYFCTKSIKQTAKV